jgi:hypothetical protein
MANRLTGRGTPDDTTLEAATDMSLLQYTFVKPSTGVAGGPSARVAVCGAGDRGWILQNKPLQYKGAVIRIKGFSALKVDGSGTAIAVGDPLKSDGAGLGIKATAATIFNAIAMEASSAAGDIIEVLVMHGQVAA